MDHLCRYRGPLWQVSPFGAARGESVEESLKALQVDRLDLLHIHSLTTEDDLAKVEATAGPLDQILKLRDQKATRFMGITSRTDPVVLKTAPERHDFDRTQMALNAGTVAMMNGGANRGLILTRNRCGGRHAETGAHFR